MSQHFPPSQQVEDIGLYNAITARFAELGQYVEWEKEVLALHYSVDDISGPLSFKPLCFTPRITTNRRRLTLTTGINKHFQFVYAVHIPAREIVFDSEGFGRFEAKLKSDARVWEIHTYDPINTSEYIKLPVHTDALSVTLSA